MKPKRVLNKWQFVFTSSGDFMYKHDGWRVADIGIFKLFNLPPDGAYPRKDNYKGFWWRFRYWLPFDRY